jgi:hypothetical protein
VDKYAGISIGQSEGGRTWGRIRSRTGFLMQMYKRERKYKIGWGDLDILQDS